MIARSEDRRPNLLRCRDQQICPYAERCRPWVLLLILGNHAVSVLNHYDRGVHKNTDCQRQAAQRHDVRSDPQKIHGRRKSGQQREV